MNLSRGKGGGKFLDLRLSVCGSDVVTHVDWTYRFSYGDSEDITKALDMAVGEFSKVFVETRKIGEQLVDSI